MKIKILLITVLIVCLNSFSFSVEVDELCQIIEAMESTYVDISVNYTWDQYPPMTKEEIAGKSVLIPIGKTQRTFMTARPFNERSLSSDKVKLTDEHNRSFDSESMESYNGKFAKHLSIGGWPESRTDGTITKRKDFMAISGLTPLKFSVFYSYPELLSKQLENTELCSIKPQEIEINGFDSICVELFLPEYNQAYRRIYFSIDHGYTPVRFEYMQKGNNTPAISIDVMELQEVSNGVWFPVKGQIKASDDERIEVYEAESAIINQGLTEKDFDFEFPAGTRLVDEIVGTQYVIRPTEEQFNKWLSDEEIRSRYSGSNNVPKTATCNTEKNSANTDSTTTAILEKPQKQFKVEDIQNRIKLKPFWLLIALLLVAGLVILAIAKKARRQK